MGPLVIVNPRAAGGRAGRTFAGVRSVIERRLGVVDAAFTERPGHAIDLAREASRQGRSLIIAVGGDGTLHEVVNGVMDAGGKTSIGYVGQGTEATFAGRSAPSTGSTPTSIASRAAATVRSTSAN